MISGGKQRALAVLYWIVPSLVCLALHWRSFDAWFRADDFAWLGVGLDVTDFRSLLHALFAPSPDGTVRPLSERAFFMASYRLFGLDPLPFRVAAFLTQFANLALVAAIGMRITGDRGAGFWAAIFWAINGALLVPLVWASAYNELMCGLCLLLAFYFLLRYVETGERRYNVAQWAVFLVGFGALELAVVYPALAAAYTWLCTRSHFRRSLWLFAGSAVYLIVHTIFVPAQKGGFYDMRVSGAVFRTLGVYWTWSLHPAGLQAPRWLALAALLLLTAGLAAFVVRKLKAGNRGPLFCLAWYLIVLSPFLLIHGHLSEYYVYLPVAGLCWLGGWAMAEAWRAGAPAKASACVLAAVYALLAVPNVVTAEERTQRLTARIRGLVEGVAGAHERHPGQAILLEGVDSDLFWNAIRDRPFRLIGLHSVHLAPGSERGIAAYPERGDIVEFVAPAFPVAGAIERGDLAVYDVRGPRLRNITSSYSVPRDLRLPLRIDAGSPLSEGLLGPEWYPADNGVRWMARRATLRIGAPSAAGQRLYLRGICPKEQFDAGPLTVSVSAGAATLPARELHAGEVAFELTFDLPAALAGRTEMEIAVEVSRTIRPASDPRDFGLAFGVFEVK